jgi:bifunctional NMN adenylyltransferase/nudix hydrolase
MAGKNYADIGIIVGRFQVAELTEAHVRLIQDVVSKCAKVLVCIGMNKVPGSKENPLGFIERKDMVLDKFPDVTVTYINDHPDDEVWSKDLDLLVRTIYPFGSICLFGGRDSFIQYYSGEFPTLELQVPSAHAGTQVRMRIGKTTINSVDFRKGIIHSCQNQYSKVYPTVDIAIMNKRKVLMGQRTANSGYRFVGGFVDLEDISYEDAICRECLEETGLEISRLQYVSSRKIEDWRYKYKTEGIMTSFFIARYRFGAIKKNDEFYILEWVDVSAIDKPFIDPEHRDLFRDLLSYLRRK